MEQLHNINSRCLPTNLHTAFVCHQQIGYLKVPENDNSKKSIRSGQVGDRQTGGKQTDRWETGRKVRDRKVRDRQVVDIQVVDRQVRDKQV